MIFDGVLSSSGQTVMEIRLLVSFSRCSLFDCSGGEEQKIQILMNSPNSEKTEKRTD